MFAFCLLVHSHPLPVFGKACLLTYLRICMHIPTPGMPGHTSNPPHPANPPSAYRGELIFVILVHLQGASCSVLRWRRTVVLVTVGIVDGTVDKFDSGCHIPTAILDKMATVALNPQLVLGVTSTKLSWMEW